MRDMTSHQTADQAEGHRRESMRVWIANGADTLVEQDGIKGVRIAASVEQKAVQASIIMQRETASGSNAPDIGTSVDARRRVRIDTALLASDETPSSGDWMPLFAGRIGDPDWGGDESDVVLPCMDDWTMLYRKWQLDEPTYGDDDSPVASETVIQQMLNDAFGSGALTLEVVGTPTTTIKEVTYTAQNVASMVQTILDVDGSDLRWRWSDSEQDFVPTYYEPARSKTTPDYTFTDDDYFGIPAITKVESEVRNHVVVIYEETGSYVEVFDSTSIALYGQQTMVLDYGKDAQITTEGLASALAANVLADTAMPAVAMTVEGRYFPWVELGDLYRFPSNNVHIDETKDLAVVGYTHEITADRATTLLQLRGTPSGGVTRWFGKAKVAEQVHTLTPSLPSVPVEKFYGTLSATFDDSGNLTAAIEGEEGVASWRVVGSIGSPPGDSTLAAATPINGQSLTEDDIGTLDTGATGGDVGYVYCIGYTQADGGGREAGTRMLDIATFGTPESGIPDDSIGTAQIKDANVTADKITNQAKSFGSTVRFQSASYNTIRWYTGDVLLADGTSVTVASRPSNLVISGTTYIYFDGTTTLQSTTSLSTALASETNILMCTAWPATVTSSQAGFVPGVGVLSAENMTVNGDNIAADSITAAKIVAGTITASEIAAGTITAAKMNVVTLSSLAIDAGTITAGLLQNSAGTTFVDLDATGTDPFIQCGSDLVMRADGSAEFGGEVTSTTFTASTITVNNVYLNLASVIAASAGPFGDITLAPVYWSDSGFRAAWTAGSLGTDTLYLNSSPSAGTPTLSVISGVASILSADLEIASGQTFTFADEGDVSFGASDSGGTGYKVLRVPN